MVKLTVKLKDNLMPILTKNSIYLVDNVMSMHFIDHCINAVYEICGYICV